jgi:hypothetical protein
MLECSGHEEMGGMGEMDHGGSMTTPECRASDTSYLTTLAFCMKTKCASFNIATSELERYWETIATGDPAVVPKWTYSQAIAEVPIAPTKVLGAEEMLDFTALVDEDTWHAAWNTLVIFEREEVIHARYA